MDSKEYLNNIMNTIQCIDCIEGMKQLLSDIYNKVVLITDPPYGINYDPNWQSKIHLALGHKPNQSNEKIIGDEKSINLSWLFNFPRRVIFGFPYIYDTKATGWIVWDKQPKVDWRGISTPVEIASTTLRKGFDLVHCMWGGYMREKDGKTELRFKHPTQKPLKIMKGIIERFTKPNDIIFDPFTGSGSTLRAAKDLGRNFMGFEISPEYVEICNKRLRQEVLF